jgi:hypothetical protein
VHALANTKWLRDFYSKQLSYWVAVRPIPFAPELFQPIGDYHLIMRL